MEKLRSYLELQQITFCPSHEAARTHEATFRYFAVYATAKKATCLRPIFGANPNSPHKGDNTMTRHTITFTPRLMQAPAASQYLGMSATKLAGLNLPAKEDGGNVLYDVRDLDAYADGLPYKGGNAPSGW